MLSWPKHRFRRSNYFTYAVAMLRPAQYDVLLALALIYFITIITQKQCSTVPSLPPFSRWPA